MATVVDTNVLVALWDRDKELSDAARRALDQAFDQGGLIVPAPVIAELMAFPGRSEAFLDTFFEDTGIVTDWNLTEPVWRAAGRAFARYASRRREATRPRRILADFLIGAYADTGGHRLLTMDRRAYRAAFPKLDLILL